MKLLLLFIAALTVGSAATTKVAQTMTGSDGLPVNGTFFITLSAGCISNGVKVQPSTVRVPFLNGAFSVALVPNDTCLVGGLANTTYTVSWSVCAAAKNATLAKPCSSPGQPRTEAWRVTTSTSVLPVYGVGGVLVTTPLTSITLTGLLDGTYCVVVTGGATTSIAPCTPGTGNTNTSNTLRGRLWASLVGTTWDQLVGTTWQ